LEQGADRENYERPLHRAKAARGGQMHRIHDAVKVSVRMLILMIFAVANVEYMKHPLGA
jgi:hypothetical protein